MSSGLDYRVIHELTHAARATFEGFRVPSIRVGNCGGLTEILFDVDADPAAVGRVLVAGSVGEEVFLGTADPWQSIADSTDAYACALLLAGDEEHEQADPLPIVGTNRPHTASAAVARLAALPTAAVAAGISRTMERRTRRAHVIVAGWREEVRAWVRANLCLIRAGYTALEGFQHLDEPQLAALLAEGRLAQLEDDAHMSRAAGTDTAGTPRTPRASQPTNDPAPGARPGGPR